MSAVLLDRLFCQHKANGSPRSWLTSCLLAALALASVVAIQVLDGHDCTGDGCVLCILAGLAHVVLFASVAATLAHPALYLLALTSGLRVAPRPPRVHERVAICLQRAVIAQTPVSLHVRLLI